MLALSPLWCGILTSSYRGKKRWVWRVIFMRPREARTSIRSASLLRPCLVCAHSCSSVGLGLATARAAR
jgi:hypothetical protein